MFSASPRSQLFLAVALDAAGQLFLLMVCGALQLGFGGLLGLVVAQGGWLALCLLLYPLLGWLFGSFTVLRWRRVSVVVLLQRLSFTSIAMLILLEIVGLLIGSDGSIWLLSREALILWIAGLTLWSLVIRVALRRGLLMQEVPQLFLLSLDSERDSLMAAWRRVPQREQLTPVTAPQLHASLENGQLFRLGVTRSLRSDPGFADAWPTLDEQDPRLVQVMSVVSLFELHQQRLPPAWLDEAGLDYDALPWAAQFSIQRQLKRIADLFLSVVLLVLTLPLALAAALLIWLEDRGPVFYAQQRTGWLGRPFTLLKLRTMSQQCPNEPVRWTEPGDQRITWVGQWLRRVRLDELPQLLNVLRGDMSLIGPRPERPELEHELERVIPHYRKRHWMRPGLSGWAQVCAPYASSVEDSDLKLSYDLYYLRHFSIGLDLLILFRTIKTVLKAAGR